MNNLLRIKKLSRIFHFLTTLFIFFLPIYYIMYWIFINSTNSVLITINTDPLPMVDNHLSFKLQIIGYLVSLLPLSSLIYGLINVRKLFSFYINGFIFSYSHVTIFKKISISLLGWVLFSIFYESVKSTLFSMGNPPGQRVISIGFSTSEITTLVVAGFVFVIAWVMDEGRILAEEQQLTV